MGEVLRTEREKKCARRGRRKKEKKRACWNIRTESGSTQGKLDYWMLYKDIAVETALMHVLYGSGATAGDKGGLVTGLEHFCQSCWP